MTKSELNSYEVSVNHYLLSDNYEAVENFFKKGGKVRNALKKIGDKVKDGVEKVGKIAVLSPFKRPMEKALEAKGIKHSGKLEDVVEKFYDNIIVKKDGAVKEAKKSESFDPVLLPTIISAVIAFFKNLKAKQESGEPLSEAEQKALDAAEEVVEGAKGAAKSEVKFAIGDFLTQYWWLLLIAVYLIFLR